MGFYLQSFSNQEIQQNLKLPLVCLVEESATLLITLILKSLVFTHYHYFYCNWVFLL